MRVSNKYCTQIIIGLFLISLSVIATENSKIKTKSKPISVLILFFGDYNSEVQFDGLFQEKIKGVNNQTKGNPPSSNCEINARFQVVQYLKENHLKIQFEIECQLLNQTSKATEKAVEAKTEKINLGPEYVRLKDLSTVSSGVYFSKAHKNVQFKIKDLKY
jgi:hypothetical protein